jgi:hypothetical protein
MTSTELEVPRSLRPAVRNPLIELPAAQRIQSLDAGTRALLRELLLEIRAAAQAKAELSWRKSKAPMAMYWKVCAVYTGHIVRLLR